MMYLTYIFSYYAVRLLSAHGLQLNSAGVLQLTDFMMCVWIWMRLFTKSSTPVSYAQSIQEDNTILLG